MPQNHIKKRKRKNIIKTLRKSLKITNNKHNNNSGNNKTRMLREKNKYLF